MLEKNLLHVLSGESLSPPPIWLMRQAGRYLPEYRAVRTKVGSFLDLVYNPEMAAEVTLQPIRRYGFDAAILFSDILVIPDALGCGVRFVEGEGPRLNPVRNLNDIKTLNVKTAAKIWAPILETVRLVAAGLANEKFNGCTLIGFAGGPWTVACYMVDGQAGDHSFSNVRDIAKKDPNFFNDLIDILVTSTIDYLSGQIRAGAETLQIFDSWAGAASDDLFDRYVIEPTRKIVNRLQRDFPHIPIIGFPRGARDRLAAYVSETGVNAVGLDTDTNLLTDLTGLPKSIVVQGNLDPMILVAGGIALDNAIDKIIVEMKDRPFIFNLGHGILPQTPPEHVAQLVARVRAQQVI